MDCRLDFEIYWKSFFLLPSLSFLRNNMVYAKPNFAINFDWLMLHARLLCSRAAAERAAAHVWKLSPRELAAIEYIDKRCGDVSRVDT